MILNRFLEKFDNDVRDLIKGSGATFLIRILGVLLLYLFTIIVTNQLGDEVYGEFAFFILSLKLISLITTAGIDTYLLRYISDDPQEAKIGKLIGDGTIAVFFNSLLFLIVIYFLAQNYYHIFFSEYWYISFLILGVIPFSISKLNAQSYRAKKNSVMFSIIEFTGVPFFTILFFYVLKTFDLENNNLPVYAYLLGVLVVFIISLYNWQFKYGKELISNFGKHLRQIGSINKLALPFLIAGSSLYFGQWSVSLILKHFEGNGVFGNFDAAFRIGYLLMMPLIAITTIAAPIFSRKFAEADKTGLERILKLTTNAIILITIPLILITYFFSEEIMALYGPDFIGSGNILKIILIGFIFNALSGPVAVFLQMAEKQVLVQNVFLYSAVINVIVSYILIPKFGVIGACWSNVFYQILINVYLLIYIKLKFGYLSFGK